MFYVDKPGRSEKSRDISWATRIGEKHAAPGFTVNTRVEHAQVVLAQRKTKWQRTCSWESDEYHNEFGDIYVYFTSGSILMVRKSEEY